MYFGLFLNQINNEDRKLFQKLIILCKKTYKIGKVQETFRNMYKI